MKHIYHILPFQFIIQTQQKFQHPKTTKKKLRKHYASNEKLNKSTCRRIK